MYHHNNRGNMTISIETNITINIADTVLVVTKQQAELLYVALGRELNKSDESHMSHIPYYLPGHRGGILSQ